MAKIQNASVVAESSIGQHWTVSLIIQRGKLRLKRDEPHRQKESEGGIRGRRARWTVLVSP